MTKEEYDDAKQEVIKCLNGFSYDEANEILNSVLEQIGNLAKINVRIEMDHVFVPKIEY